MVNSRGFIENLRSLGVVPEDSDEVRLGKSLMIFATGLFCLALVGWFVIYRQFDPSFPLALPLALLALVALNVSVYFGILDFDAFCRVQLSFFLFFPFIMQWSLGDFVASSGISLMAVIAPVGALLVAGPREAFAWFFAFVALTALSGLFDYSLADVSSGAFLPASPRTSIFFFALNFMTVAAVVFLILRQSVIEKKKVQIRLRETLQRLQTEQDRSEQLLLNTLPKSIAARLKNSGETIADGLADISVMFVDIVNFTHLASGLRPKEVFAILNQVFSSLDDLTERFGMEKIKTIGDAYMVAGGLSGSGDGEYSLALVEMAMVLRDVVENDAYINGIRLQVRIGIASGPVVAGVVGKKKFTYDLWGNTVNVASRLTGESEPGMIQVDETTFLRLGERFDFEGPKILYLKGKGGTPVYRVVGRK